MSSGFRFQFFKDDREPAPKSLFLLVVGKPTNSIVFKKEDIFHFCALVPVVVSTDTLIIDHPDINIVV